MNNNKIFLTQKELAERWKKSPQTLSYTKIDGQIRYDLDDIIKIEQDSKVEL